MRNIFVPGVGQYDNIGDIILRRQLIAWLRPMGRLHVYVGGSPAGFAESLGLGDGDIVYRSFASWYRAALAAGWRGGAHYVFKPGEIQLTIVGMKEHVSVLPILALMRLRGGSVTRVGSGSREFATIPRLLIQPSIALSNITRWRDARTASYLGRGGVMPDLAFAEGSALDAGPTPVRDTVVVSMRSDRPVPDEAWFEGIRRYSASRGLRLVVVTQVLRDRERSVLIAERLGAELLDWDGSEHGVQEERLRGLYHRSVLAVSDRLHVLITALTEGAMPVALLVDVSDKIERHFDAAGISGVGIATSGLTADAIAALLVEAAGRGESVARALAGARAELADVRSDVERTICAGDVVVAAGVAA